MSSESLHNIRDIKDKHSFQCFYESLYPLLCLFSNSYLNDKDVAQDIVQDAFFYLWNKRSDFNSVVSAKSYLYLHVKNRSLNYLRDKNIRLSIDLSRLGSELFYRDVLIEQEAYKKIMDAIRSLPPQGQRIIEMMLDGMKNQEIADELNISVNTVKTIKSRAFESLRKELKSNLFYLLVFLRSVPFE